MTVINYADFKENLKTNLDNICDNKDVVTVVTMNNKDVVLMSLDEYNSWQETKYLLSSVNNHKRLEEAIKDTEQGIFETHDLIEE